LWWKCVSLSTDALEERRLRDRGDGCDQAVGNVVRSPVIRGGAAGEESGPIWDRSTLDFGPHDMRRATA
jgi:hypothetical protein